MSKIYDITARVASTLLVLGIAIVSIPFMILITPVTTAIGFIRDFKIIWFKVKPPKGDGSNDLLRDISEN